MASARCRPEHVPIGMRSLAAFRDGVLDRASIGEGDVVLDLGTGSGLIGFGALDLVGDTGQVIFSDISAELLDECRRRAGDDKRCSFVEMPAGELDPIADASVDVVTTRSVLMYLADKRAAFTEIARVLRPGGRFLCLEFSTVDVPGLDRLYDLYSFNVIPALGGAVAGDAESYRYLVESIRRFPRPQAFADMIAAAGFRRSTFRLLTGGVVALHSAWRL